MDALAAAAAGLPLRAELLGICRRGDPDPWTVHRRAARHPSPGPLPSLGRPRLRPGAAGPTDPPGAPLGASRPRRNMQGAIKGTLAGRASGAARDPIGQDENDGAEEPDLGDRPVGDRPLRLAIPAEPFLSAGAGDDDECDRV